MSMAPLANLARLPEPRACVVWVQMSMGYRAAPPAYHQPSSHHQQPYGYQPRGGPGYGGRGGYAPHYPPAQYTQPHQYGGPGYGAEPYRGGYGGAGAGASGGEGGLTAEEEAWLLEQEDLLAGEADDSGLTAEDFERMALHAAQVRGHTGRDTSMAWWAARGGGPPCGDAGPCPLV